MDKKSKYRIPSLIALRAFEAAGRHECFTKAAEELSVTQSAISRQIKLLEDQLGVKVFDRNGRNVKLSREGRKLHITVVDAFGRIEEGANTARQTDDSKTLVISMESVFAMKWLAPRLVDLMSSHPEIDLRLSSPTNGLDLNSEGVDAAIIYGKEKSIKADKEELFRGEFFPVCSPAMANGIHALSSPLDLASATLLHGSFKEDWRQWLLEAGYPQIDCSGGPRFSDEGALIQAAISGLGVGLGRSLLVEGDLATGGLIEPFDIRVTSSRSTWLAVPRSGLPHPHLALFRSWLKNTLTRDGHGHSPEHPEISNPARHSGGQTDTRPHITSGFHPAQTPRTAPRRQISETCLPGSD